MVWESATGRPPRRPAIRYALPGGVIGPQLQRLPLLEVDGVFGFDLLDNGLCLVATTVCLADPGR